MPLERELDQIVSRQDRQGEWLKELDGRVDVLEDLPVKMELMTAAFNRLTGWIAGAIVIVVASAAVIVFFGGPT